MRRQTERLAARVEFEFEFEQVGMVMMVVCPVVTADDGLFFVGLRVGVVVGVGALLRSLRHRGQSGVGRFVAQFARQFVRLGD